MRGAKYLTLKELEARGYVSPWIMQLSRSECPKPVVQAHYIARDDAEEE